MLHRCFGPYVFGWWDNHSNRRAKRPITPHGHDLKTKAVYYFSGHPLHSFLINHITGSFSLYPRDDVCKKSWQWFFHFVPLMSLFLFTFDWPHTFLRPRFSIPVQRTAFFLLFSDLLFEQSGFERMSGLWICRISPFCFFLFLPCCIPYLLNGLEGQVAQGVIGQHKKTRITALFFAFSYFCANIQSESHTIQKKRLCITSHFYSFLPFSFFFD